MLLAQSQIKQEPKDEDDNEPDACAVAGNNGNDTRPDANYTLLSFSNEQIYHCRMCSFETSEMDVIVKHCQNHNSSEFGTCDLCSFVADCPSDLQTHRFLHYNSRMVCYSCDMACLSPTTYRQHLETFHFVKHIKQESIQKEKFYCITCQQLLPSSSSFVYHVGVHAKTEENSYFCKFCTLQFIGRSALQSHLNGPRHTEVKKRLPDMLMCSECRILFPNRDSYAMHKLTRAKYGTCVATSQETALHSSLNAKPDILSGSGNLETGNIANASQNQKGECICSKCYIVCSDQTELATHMVKHASEERAKRRSLRPRSAPAMHDRKMASFLPYVCKMCTHGFDTQDALAMHVMTEHANEDVMTIKQEPGSDNTAQKRTCHSEPLSQSSVMQRMTNISLEKFVCLQCNEMFSCRDTLAMHVMIGHAYQDEDASRQQTRPGSASSSIIRKRDVEGNMLSHQTTSSRGLHPKAMPNYTSKTENSDPEPLNLTKLTAEKIPVQHSLYERRRSHDSGNKVNETSHNTHSGTIYSNRGISAASNTGRESTFVRPRLSDESSSSEPSGDKKQMNPDTTANTSHQIAGDDTTQIIEFVIDNKADLAMCRYCKLVFVDKTLRLYYLHMGLHNLNNPWQCNLCGKTCQDVTEFTAHVIHY